ncbi:transcriptional regulator [Rhodanobacter glycinis]|uniref:Uncharacterized protein n=1 Tax=Rhodanobacter glycinis TaxID=582702 RepID=A0A1I4CRD3_9GAMM|nr:transcriptional regulator [Rhodanobacter glycinis]SFK83818.1 hypothetical protein SAMN05192579_107143 [Rhodanobacter glycinis]
MALTRDFNEAVRSRASSDAAFRRQLLCNALGALLEGELDVGKSVLRDYINATIGFEGLSVRVGTPSKSLHRMFGPQGNPKSANLFNVISTLQQAEQIRLEVSVSTGG